LIVDDELDLREILGAWFPREGARVLVAENGAEAQKAIDANPIDIVVSDVRMPIMDGITLLKSIKANHQYKPSVMFVSGFTDIEPREAYDLGIEAVMSKPVDGKELLAVVTRVLAERNELWLSLPTTKAEIVLDAVFESLELALSQRLLLFGRGGFCLQSASKFTAGPGALLLDFQADQRRVKGSGVIRWTSHPEPEIGVEIYVHRR
jgi:DNA-binding response OmpR family regulator